MICKNIYYFVEITESQNRCSFSQSDKKIVYVGTHVQWTLAVKIGTCDLLYTLVRTHREFSLPIV